MKSTSHTIILAAAVSAICILVSSCGAADPTVQKELDRDILEAAENNKPGSSTGPQQGRGSRNWGHGGY